MRKYVWFLCGLLNKWSKKSKYVSGSIVFSKKLGVAIVIIARKDEQYHEIESIDKVNLCFEKIKAIVPVGMDNISDMTVFSENDIYISKSIEPISNWNKKNAFMDACGITKAILQGRS